MGIYVSAFIFLFGFAVVWHITWLIVVGLLGALVCVIIRTFDDETEYILKASVVEQLERKKNTYD